ncbi:MAG: aminoacyl--tRNA ligase-related protein [Candidatus Paceibacterota bacterium]|jgi:prolyl-tRNA synthetase
MKQSELFAKTVRTFPKDEEAISAKFLIRAGFVDKLMAGVYTLLPLGLRVMKKVEQIIREEINAVGGQEIFMPSFQPKENWMKTGRWETMTDLYKVKDSSDREFALGPTHEEVVVPLIKRFASSYKDLPVYVYQFQNKFRMELRSKGGLLRGREFMMKDLYSFHLTEGDLDEYYNRVKEAYFKIFDRIGIRKKTYFTFASGGTFSKYSHEFQTVTPAGEDTIYVCSRCSLAINKEIKNELNKCAGCGGDDFKEEKAIEVGNIFKLKDKYTQPFDFSVMDDDGKKRPVMMGCYGIGLGRTMATVIEVSNDERGMIWPEEIAPFRVHIIELDGKSAKKICADFEKRGEEILYDERGVSPGEKFADADLIGIPWRIVVSKKAGSKVEVKNRAKAQIKLMEPKQAMKLILK